mgnify:CR=1 FL=1
MSLLTQEQIDALAIDKPDNFIFHEYGIPSEQGASANPFVPSGTNIPDEELQNKWLRASCDAIHQNVAGGYIWAAYYGEALTDDSATSLSYDIIGKPRVESSIKDCFGWY